jgi:phosphoglycolate phosphatase-like HAD superfamily hydrolase
MNITTCIFDFDGTLVDSLMDVLESLKTAFDRCGISADLADGEKVVQLQLREAIAAVSPGITPEQTETVVGVFRDIYDSSDYPNTALMPGAREALQEFAEKGIGMYIVSNKRRLPTLRILDKFGIRSFFFDIFNPDLPGLDKPATKPRLIAMLLKKRSIRKDAAVYVGDSEGDVKAARENGVAAVIVANGYGKTEGFSVRPDFAIRRLRDLPAIVRRLSSQKVPSP